MLLRCVQTFKYINSLYNISIAIFSDDTTVGLSINLLRRKNLSWKTHELELKEHLSCFQF